MQERKLKILRLIDEAHKIIEDGYHDLRQPKDEQATNQQRQFLLADMACHLIQDAMRDDITNSESLKNRLYAILTISDDFLTKKELKPLAQTIID
ncbi:hypothetical protein [Ichthyenterobacterium magnum]|uniref:MazG-like nucleotide pyrophosphohydrolase family protein n=1 Tax=Ichthyenterobacterium magnum TaxID=1230530 RepID=A0A420DM57_9FLAO|nr:hypothetical protein [Ichthyenterobacterium magnum]RKE95291.1 hypothetical protein BXY80_1478 [Ichthyenterobacterium magnum]